MLTLKPSTIGPASAGHISLDSVRVHMAQSLVGQTVDLLTDARTIIHGVVSGVLSDTELPKIVVNRKQYDLKQILTASPTVLK